MDKNQDNKLSQEEIQDGFAMFRHFIFMSHVIIKDLISQFYLFPPGVSVLQFSGSSKPLTPIFQRQAALMTGWRDSQKGSTWSTSRNASRKWEPRSWNLNSKFFNIMYLPKNLKQCHFDIESMRFRSSPLLKPPPINRSGYKIFKIPPLFAIVVATCHRPFLCLRHHPPLFLLGLLGVCGRTPLLSISTMLPMQSPDFLSCWDSCVRHW